MVGKGTGPSSLFHQFPNLDKLKRVLSQPLGTPIVMHCVEVGIVQRCVGPGEGGVAVKAILSSWPKHPRTAG